MPLNPRSIPSNLRLQSSIEEELTKAKELLKSKPEEALSSNEQTNLVLIFLEIGDWPKVEKYASSVIAIKTESTTLAQENKAIAFYASGTRKRELNFCDEAFIDLSRAQELAQSDWLKSNLLRQIGLVHLKLKNFQEAVKHFQKVFNLVKESPDQLELKGSLPALHNYWALSLTKALLADNQAPTLGLSMFEETTRLYEVAFEERGMRDDASRRGSHDFISHCVHRGMILCERGEGHPTQDHRDNLEQAEALLTQALTSRKENKADGVRLGDTCAWLGRVYTLLGDTSKAMVSFKEAVEHYKKILPEESNQINDVNNRLQNLMLKTASVPNLSRHGSFSSDSSKLGAQAASPTSSIGGP